MYRCERWTIKKAEHWKIDAFKFRCWRRLWRVPWTARRSNKSYWMGNKEPRFHTRTSDPSENSKALSADWTVVLILRTTLKFYWMWRSGCNPQSGTHVKKQNHLLNSGLRPHSVFVTRVRPHSFPLFPPGIISAQEKTAQAKCAVHSLPSRHHVSSLHVLSHWILACLSWTCVRLSHSQLEH